MYKLLILLEFIINSKINRKRTADHSEQSYEHRIKKPKTIQISSSEFIELSEEEKEQNISDYFLKNNENVQNKTPTNSQVYSNAILPINEDRDTEDNFVKLDISHFYQKKSEENYDEQDFEEEKIQNLNSASEINLSVNLDPSNPGISQKNELKEILNLDTEIKEENINISSKIILFKMSDVHNKKTLDEIYDKFIKEYGLFSISNSTSFNLEKDLEKILRNNLAQVINGVESNAPFRFNFYLRHLSKIRNRNPNFLDYMYKDDVQKSVNNFLHNFIVCTWRNEFEADEKKPNNIYQSYGDFLKNSEFLQRIKNNFDKFLTYQFEKFLIFFNAEKRFFYSHNFFLKFSKNETFNCKLLIRIFERLFEIKQFAYINLLFPEIKMLINILDINNVSSHECKKVFFIFGFIIFKSELLKNKIKDDINITIGDIIYDYQYSITLCKYILDVRSLLYLTCESLIAKSGAKFLTQDKNMLIHLFFNYIRVFFPYVLKHFQIDEFFFMAHKLKDVELFKPKVIYKKIIRIKKIIEIWGFDDFSEISDYKNLEDFKQKIYDSFKEAKESDIKANLNTEILLDWDIESYFGIIKKKLNTELINLIG